MGILDFFKRKPKLINEPLNGPGPSALKTLDEFQNNDYGPGPVIRDFGMQSRTLREALEVLQEAAPTLPGLNLFLDQNGFRSMNRSIRDMNEASRMNLTTRCETVSVINPVAVRAMNIRTDLIVSEGFKLESTAKDEKNKARVQAVLDSHWELNQWEDELFSRMMDLGVLGEFCTKMPPLDRKIGDQTDDIISTKSWNPGIFRCGLVIPHMIRRAVLSPWNYENIDTIYMQEVTYPGMEVITNNENMELKVVRDERIDVEEFGSIRGEVFYTTVNKRPGATRGLSDIAPVLDYLDCYDQMFFSNIERYELMKKFIWDVTIDNASARECEAYLRRIKVKGPDAGTVRVHNQRERWEAVSPDLGTPANNEFQDALFKHCWGGMGLPFPWWTEGGDTNRATMGSGQTDACFAWARTRKRLVSKRLLLEARYAVQIAADAGRLYGVPTEELGVRIISRDPDRRGYEQVGAAWKDIADSLNILVQSQMVDTTSAANIVRVVLGSYGFEIDPKLLETQLKQQDKQLKQAQKQGLVDQFGNPIQQQADPNDPNAQPGQPGQPQNGQNGSANNGPPKKPKSGIMSSSNSLDATMNEAFPWLERQQREERRLRNQF